MVELKQIREQFVKDRATQTYLETQLQTLTETLQEQMNQGSNLLEVRGLFQKAAQETQKKLEFHINNLVSAALASVFEEDPYEFQLEFVQKRGKTEAEVWFVRNGEKLKPIDASGGGAVDVADLAARIAFWSLTKKTRPLFILDEPFRNLNEGRQERALDMLRMLSEKTNLQIVMISHIKQLISGADKEFKLVLKSGRSALCQ
jgi:DNA repair exonuclease SbcCD ATPase subunit